MRSYGEACAASHALDLIGERWALLVVRELLLGPKRFSDLQRGMPTASPRILTLRLRELEEAGVLTRRRLGPPSGCSIYQLTEWGRGLEAVLIQLGRWGRTSPTLPVEGEVTVDGTMLALRSRFDPAVDPDLRASYALRFGADHLAVSVADGEISVARAEPDRPDATVDTDPRTFAALLAGRLSVADAAADGRCVLGGDATALPRLLATVGARG